MGLDPMESWNGGSVLILGSIVWIETNLSGLDEVYTGFRRDLDEI